ncbi:MAG: trypsin-like peptidase domain-containing protein [Phycisphaerae bacterium]|nr:trypsin-like peptidase domain-containing protein [Phycisphaerae bacterium]
MKSTKIITRTLALFIATIISTTAADTVPGQLTEQEIDFAQKLNNTVRRAAQIASPAVVSLRVVKQNGNDIENPLESIGSGCIITPQGHIVTNNHLVQETQEVRVILADGQEFIARNIMLDPDTDLAVIKINPTGQNLPVITFGDSDQSQVGDFVLAIGNPFGMLSQTVTSGIISFKGRKTHILGQWGLEDFIQTDAVINKGNSGGPLTNLYGEVIGINSNIYSLMGHATGYGFAIPSNTAKYVCEQLIKFKKVQRGYLGVAMSPLTLAQIRRKVTLKDPIDPAIIRLTKTIPATMEGVLVQTVFKNTPAARAGMKNLDILLKIDDTEVTSSRQASELIARLAPRVKVKCTLWRDKKELELEVTLGRREVARKKMPTSAKDALETPPATTPPIEPFRPSPDQSVKLGIRPILITPEMARQYGYPPTTTGIMVTNLLPGSIAAENGLKNGDIIQTINGNPTPGTQDGMAILLFLIDQAKLNHGSFSLAIINKTEQKTFTFKMP